MFRRLAAQGLWPGPEPFWHTRDGRDGTLGWDWEWSPLPDWREDALAGSTGVVVLGGATSGSEVDLLVRNEAASHAGMSLARDRGIGPVVLCSSAAVYGLAPGPHREDGPTRPASAYATAKRTMEEAARYALQRHEAPPTCALRIGNVAGADALFGAMAAGPVTLDRLPDGTSPRRAYVGPLALARALVALLAQPDLPPVLNLAQPGLLPMSDLLDAASHPFAWRPAPPTALPALEMDLSRLQALAPLPPATPEGLVAEARLAGWRAFGEAP